MQTTPLQAGDALKEGQYKIVRKVGEGRYSDVFKCIATRGSQEVAIKIAKGDATSAQNAADENRIFKVLQDSQCPNFIQVKDVFTHEGRQCFVLELMACTLSKQYRFRVLKELIVQFNFMMNSMQRYQIIHGDFRPENLMLKNAGKAGVKLIDFGNAQTVKSRLAASTRPVTPYTAPEILLGMRKYNTHSDIWSMGCVIYEIHTGKPLFRGESRAELLNQIFSLVGWPSAEFLRDSPHFSTIFSLDTHGHLQFKDHNLRNNDKLSDLFDVEKKLIHVPEFAESDDSYGLFINLLRRLLTVEPANRATAREIFNHAFLDGSKLLHKKPADDAVSASTSSTLGGRSQAEEGKDDDDSDDSLEREEREGLTIHEANESSEATPKESHASFAPLRLDRKPIRRRTEHPLTKKASIFEEVLNQSEKESIESLKKPKRQLKGSRTLQCSSRLALLEEELNLQEEPVDLTASDHFCLQIRSKQHASDSIFFSDITHEKSKTMGAVSRSKIKKPTFNYKFRDDLLTSTMTSSSVEMFRSSFHSALNASILSMTTSFVDKEALNQLLSTEKSPFIDGDASSDEEIPLEIVCDLGEVQDQ